MTSSLTGASIVAGCIDAGHSGLQHHGAARPAAAVRLEQGPHAGAGLVGHGLPDRRLLGGAVERRGRSTGYLPPGLPNAMLFIACGMMWNAARLFHSRGINWLAMSAGAIVWLVAVHAGFASPRRSA